MLAERGWFVLSMTSGRVLRSARYSKVWTSKQNGELQVRKRRAFFAPLLIRVGAVLLRSLNTGVRILPQREWEDRERLIYRTLGRPSVRIDPDGALVLPCLPGRTLAELLEDGELEEAARKRAIELAVAALGQFHRLNLTHGDAMAANVMVDLEGGVARWFDFETLHDASRSLAWRRADDVRALLATCVVRRTAQELAATVKVILDVYADEEVCAVLARRFSSAFQRPLAFHLGQAGLSFRYFREVGRLVGERTHVRTIGRRLESIGQ